jgi:probable F420-dependent oxidoreductase
VLVSVNLPVGDGVTAASLGACARAAEAAGIDAVYVTDHPAPSERWLTSGGHPTLDPFVALAAAAASTSTIRLHTNLLVLPYRNPLLAAKSVASLDVLSEGRVILGVGVGYLRAEFDALGADFDGRGDAADLALATMRSAWSGEPRGSDGVVVRPVPVQRPHPPIWVGGNSVRAMRRAVEHGQGWSPMPSPSRAADLLGTPGIETIDELARRIALLHQLAADAGRTEPLDVAVIPTSLSGFASAGWSASQVIDEIGRLRDAGGTALIVDLPSDTHDEWLSHLAHLTTIL